MLVVFKNFFRGLIIFELEVEIFEDYWLDIVINEVCLIEWEFVKIFYICDISVGVLLNMCMLYSLF